MPIFNQNGQHLVFGPRFGEIAQLRAIYFGSNIVEGVAEGWVDVDVGGCTV